MSTAVLAVDADDPPVDRLLDQDRDDDTATRSERSEQEGEPQPVAQHRDLAQSTADRRDRRLARLEAGGESGGHDAPARSASNASTIVPIARHAIEQLVVCAVGGHPPGRHEHDIVGQRDRRRPRCDHQHRRLERRPQPIEDRLLGRRVERRGRVVEDQDRRTPHERPGERDPLALTTAEADPALADHGVESGRQRPHELVGRREVQRRPHLVVGRRGCRTRRCHAPSPR